MKWSLHRCTRHRCTWLALVLLLAAGCSDPDDPEPPRRAFLGVFALARGLPGADRQLEDAYLDVSGRGVSLAHLRLDWGQTELRLGAFDWSHLADHVNQSVRRGVPLSVEVTLIDNQVRGTVPADLEGQWIDGENFRVRFARFLLELIERGNGRIEHLWIGREVDAYFVDQRDEIEHFRTLLSSAADSVGSAAPDVGLGSTFAFSEALLDERLEVIDEITPGLSQIGLSIYGRNLEYSQVGNPQETVAQLREAVTRFAPKTVVVTETGFPGQGTTDSSQLEFAERLTDYLSAPPDHLEGVIWHALNDYSEPEAEEVATRIYGPTGTRHDNYSQQLRTLGLKQLDGVSTVTWFFVRDWNRLELVTRRPTEPAVR